MSDLVSPIIKEKNKSALGCFDISLLTSGNAKLK